MKDLKKVIIRLNGRLGNQLFQLALALNIAHKFNVEILLDDYLSNRKGFERFLFKELAVFNYFNYISQLGSYNSRIQHNFTLRKFYKTDRLFIEAEHGNCQLSLARPYRSYTGFFRIYTRKIFISNESMPALCDRQ